MLLTLSDSPSTSDHGDVQIAKCPNCGAPLGVRNGVEVCDFCGAKDRVHTVEAKCATLPPPDIADDEDDASLCGRFVASVKTYANKEPGADERLMRAVEDALEIPDARRDAFRREIVTLVSALATEGVKFEATTNERVGRALAAVLAR